jgi:peroxiredoxin
MRLFFIVISLTILAIACNNPPPTEDAIDPKYDKNAKCLLTGTITGMDTGWMLLAPANIETRGLLGGDYIRVKNGKFLWSANLSGPTLYWLGTGTQNEQTYSRMFFVDSGTTHIDVRGTDIANAKIYGTKTQDQLNAFNSTNFDMTPVVSKEEAENLRKDSVPVEQLVNLFIEAGDIMHNPVVQFVKNNPASIISAYLIYQYLTDIADAEILEPLYGGLDEKIKQSAFGKKIREAWQAGLRTAKGKPAPPFALPDHEGNEVSLSSLNGKILLLVFWDSRCSYCRTKNKELKDAYTMFSYLGFEIAGISFDQVTGDWRSAIRADRLPGIQLIDRKGDHGELKKTYGIGSLPQNLLLDKKGKIIAKNIWGVDLETKLQELLY